MKIYFSCSITGGRSDEPVYQAVVESLIQQGHQVLTAHLVDPNIVAKDGQADGRAVYERDVAWVKECDLLLAEVSTPSHGVGYEVALALLTGKPVLCLHHWQRQVSKMITGNTHPNFRLGVYSDIPEAVLLVRLYLAAGYHPG